ncbi:hypothetical protein CYMTET_8534 [Cymbomonas tetramitiformis]|uniref:Potassium channel tetramerisation-type BTB domain-containing protein n=1 Tax=Cymbomonas tetramitiformis TaxID=36881 RepID=A0AAE0GSW6_9CHLO|nr:hypothetical protein CYMTET_8534 [Cymbomonas tetramitiformis]
MVVDLNVGGSLFLTTKGTITKNPVLNDLVRYSLENGLLKDGAVFIDRCPKQFSFILNWLRNNDRLEAKTARLPLPKDSQALKELYLEATFYRLTGLSQKLQRLAFRYQRTHFEEKRQGRTLP